MQDILFDLNFLISQHKDLIDQLELTIEQTWQDRGHVMDIYQVVVWMDPHIGGN